jgi:putative transposase
MTRDRYAKNAGAVVNLKYHVVWCPKYGRPVLVPPIVDCLRDIFNQVAAEYGFLLHTVEVMPDHVHLFVEADPTRSVAEIVNRFKGPSSRFLRHEFPSLRSHSLPAATAFRAVERVPGFTLPRSVLAMVSRSANPAGSGSWRSRRNQGSLASRSSEQAEVGNPDAPGR